MAMSLPIQNNVGESHELPLCEPTFKKAFSYSHGVYIAKAYPVTSLFGFSKDEPSIELPHLIKAVTRSGVENCLGRLV